MADTRQPTTPTTGEDEVEVTPADRSAAWPFRSEPYRDEDWGAWMCGRYDRAPIIQAFARSRIAALAAISPTTEDVERYDAGLLNDYGGGNVAWWQDYLRAELERAHEHYASQIAAISPTSEDAEKRALVEALGDLIELARPNVYPQPDKPDSPYAKLERARALLASIGERS